MDIEEELKLIAERFSLIEDPTGHDCATIVGCLITIDQSNLPTVLYEYDGEKFTQLTKELDK